jgi:uncharacterized membrane protein (DUF2068 family)
MPQPLSVTVLAGFLFLATAIAAVVGISLLFPNPLLDWIWELNKPGASLFHSVGRISGVFLLALGIGTLAAGFGLLRGRQWAWWFAVVLFAIDASGNVVSWFLIHDALRTAAGLLVSTAILCLLAGRNVRSYFFRNHVTADHDP